MQRCKDIIAHFAPAAWFTENPQSGLRKTRQVVAGVLYVDVEYCMHGFPYRKRMRLRANAAEHSWTRLCKHDCGAYDGKRHNDHAHKAGYGTAGCFSTIDLHRMPPFLCADIYEAVEPMTTRVELASS